MRKQFFLPFLVAVGLGTAPAANAVGTLAGTDIDNTAEVTYEVSGSGVTEVSNTLTVTVAEILDVDVTLQSPPSPVTPGDSAEELLFTVTNVGNGSEAFSLVLDSALAGDDFDPVPSAPSAIYFDTDGSGDLSAGDTPYNPGVNDPVLAADASIDVLIVNDIPATTADGDIGRSLLDATSVTGNGAPGTVFAGAGDGGVDAVAGNSGATDNDTGEYVVSDIQLAVVKSASVADQFGGTEPVPGASIIYTIVVTPSGGGTAANAAFTDPVPANTTYTPATITLNGAPLSDAPDADAGELVTIAGVPTISVALGDLTAASGPQTVVFTVTID
ncbi:MAG: hypothetical protein KJO54_13575 [Gammaproteobacteria bacterium]|nr:hypothetical protein [Gammaproteobacteria bacterium]NNF59856.1 hypothetical protein [Gammaproteobacteria bacterium]NNM21270.1 hypothetical protein [Gammaproteobacteria bacterium]